VNKVQRELIRDKLWATFRLFGFAIGINVLSAFTVFMIKLGTDYQSNLNFIDDWLLKVILPTSFSALLFVIIFLVEWNRLTLGDYSSSVMKYGDFEEFLVENRNYMNSYKKATKRERKIILKRIIKNFLDKLPLIIFNEDSEDKKKITREDLEDLLVIQNFLNDNIEVLDQSLDIVNIWRIFICSRFYCEFLGAIPNVSKNADTR
jgi:hypothetical protein